jgi:DNA-directed RNA polymerase subunit RPC12/RpoP
LTDLQIVGLILGCISPVVASQFFIYYKLGRMEQHIINSVNGCMLEENSEQITVVCLQCGSMYEIPIKEFTARCRICGKLGLAAWRVEDEPDSQLSDEDDFPQFVGWPEEE